MQKAITGEMANSQRPSCRFFIARKKKGEKAVETIKSIFLDTVKQKKITSKQEELNEIFIKKARKVHGDKYNYSMVNYKNSGTKVCIICPEHGEFWQTPHDHLMNHGCPRCGIESRARKRSHNTEIFIEKAKAIHGDKYDYSKVNYENYNAKVCIICPEHGEFWQRPDNHLHGARCPKCAKEIKSKKQYLNTDLFIEKARTVHGDKYDYSKVNYSGSKIKVCIICPEHGEFWQIPAGHLQGYGCPKCGKISMAKIHSLGNDVFIERSEAIHGDKYDYSEVNYNDDHTKVCIICPEHGPFWQTPSDHMQGHGCPKCAGCYMDKKYFVELSNKVHGNKYDYSRVIYDNANTKVCIICPEHGPFWQKPASHLQGQGCPKCSHRSYKKTTEEFVAESRIIHGDKYDYSKVDYKNAHTKVCIICPEHGEFWQSPIEHLKGNGCPLCNESKLESTVLKALNKTSIDFIAQKPFTWMRYIKPMRLDFYLPEYNVAIECQGGQHFEPVEFFGGKDGYKKTCRRDDLKNKLCKEHGIKILYFADDEDYIEGYRYDVITDIEELLEIIKSEKRKIDKTA